MVFGTAKVDSPLWITYAYPEQANSMIPNRLLLLFSNIIAKVNRYAGVSVSFPQHFTLSQDLTSHCI